MLIFAGADYFIQKFNYLNKHKMTKQETKDEYKQLEGDPLVKAKIRSLRMERFRNQMMQSIPKADAVITNPTHYAVAILYDNTDPNSPKIPIVVAKGIDFLALRIKDKAKEHDVPIIENPPLARALYAAVEINEPIPSEHFEAVAKIISYVYKLKGKKLQ
ncbi:MAG: Flagellar biosynthetic protein FlhB [Alphaproteobacteria bacterium ADurb.Bin438]|nr:MAG: Flagellar biosynthetic protein FlhB [Alphaproteobacteria bacterium ADurb.Bin438]